MDDIQYSEPDLFGFAVGPQGDFFVVVGRDQELSAQTISETQARCFAEMVMAVLA